MNQIFLGEPSQYIKNWFIENFPSWPTYTILEFVDGTTQTKEITSAATWKNIGVKSSEWSGDNTLKSCQLGKKVTEISNYAFDSCYSLTSVNIPDSVSSIGYYAFSNCSSLTSINIPNSVTSIGDSAFRYCYSLTSVNIPNSVTLFNYCAFADCSSLTSITIPNTLSSIEEGALSNCSLPSITIPDSVTSIGYGAFSECSSLTSIIFEGKTMSQITSMANYPWDIDLTSTIIYCSDGTIIGCCGYYDCCGYQA